MTSGKSKTVAFIIALAAVYFFSAIGGGGSPDGAAPSQILPVKRPLSEGRVFPAPELEAKAAYVFDIKEKRGLYAKNENVQLPLASLAKLMTALVALRNAPENELVTISENAVKKEGDSGLFIGEKWPLKNLIGLTLVSSSNDGAAAIAEAFNYRAGDETNASFVEKMNYAARELGLKQTYFLNETGLDFDGTTSGAYGSAKDVSKLLINILSERPEIAEMTSYKEIVASSIKDNHHATNTNRILDEIPGLLLSKTGYTDLAGGNLAVIFEVSAGRPIVAVVLGSTEEGRFSDMKKIIETTVRFLKTD